MRRAMIALLVLSAIGLASPVDAAQRLEISGTPCPRLGAYRSAQKSTFICTSKGKRKVWVKLGKESATTTTVVQKGTFSNPIQKGSSGKSNDMEIIVLGLSWNAGDEVCKANMFNDGCKTDSNYDGVVDPNSKNHWVRVDLNLKNIGNKLIDLPYNYTYAVSVAGRLYGETEFVASIDSINDVKFNPGSVVNTSFYASVPKSVGTANVLFAIRPLGQSYSYFATS